jgi:salicylate hydroxylase
MQSSHVLLVGAGIGGLTAALALQREGFRVSVFEQAPELGEVGAGLTITPNARHVLDHLGLDQIMLEIGLEPNGGGVTHYQTGEMLVPISRGRSPKEVYGAAYCQTHRADLHGALAQLVLANDPAAIHTNHECTGFTQDEHGVRAHFANGREIAGDVLVGCDGIRSSIRRELFGSGSPEFTGYVAWRGLVPMDKLDPALIVPDSAVVIGPGHSVTRYRVRNGTILNYVAIAHCSDWQEEGWSVRSEVAEVLAEFSEFHDGVKAILSATPPDACYKWGLFDRDPIAQWTVGRVSLLGDAAHPMLPFLGQGAVMAIEDGMILARAFAASNDVYEGLARYENARKERTTLVMLESRANGKRLTSGETDHYDRSRHRNEEVLGLFSYNPVTEPV